MMLLNITKNIIKIGMILTSISILGCCKSKSQHILLPIDNVIYFMLDVNNDTTTIIEKKGLYSREVLKYYCDHDNVFTSDYGGDKELLMSVTQLSDSIYTGWRFRRHRILIQKESLNLYSTSIFDIDIKQVPVITIFYDKAYNVKAIRNWLVYTTYKP